MLIYDLAVLCFSRFFFPLYINTMLQHYNKINISASFIRKTLQFCSENINHSNCSKLIQYIPNNLLASASWHSVSHQGVTYNQYRESKLMFCTVDQGYDIFLVFFSKSCGLPSINCFEVQKILHLPLNPEKEGQSEGKLKEGREGRRRKNQKA